MGRGGYDDPETYARFTEAMERLEAEVLAQEPAPPGWEEYKEVAIWPEDGYSVLISKDGFETWRQEIVYPTGERRDITDIDALCRRIERLIAEPYARPDALVQRLRTATARVEEAMQPGWTGADQELTQSVPAGPRFGGRLSAWADTMPLWACQIAPDLRALAAAIDQDALDALGEAITEEMPLSVLLRPEQSARMRLRRQVEEAVERLRYSVINPLGSTAADRRHSQKDVLDAEAFQSELDRIFGDRQECGDLAGEALDLLREIVNSVPATYNENDETVKRHARALNAAAEWLRDDPPPLEGARP